MAFLSGFEKIVRQDEPLAMHTWFQLGGPAEYFAEPENLDQLIELIRRAGDEGLDVRLLGQGSNILVNDDGVPGLVIKLSSPEFCKIEIIGRRITAGGGAPLVEEEKGGFYHYLQILVSEQDIRERIIKVFPPSKKATRD